jgi:hypothetical protein
MRRIGFSTGALAFADFRRGLEMLRGTSANAVELSALRPAELDPLVDALDTLDLAGFDFISVHAPAGADPSDEQRVVDRLASVAAREWPIVVHPDSIHQTSLWRRLGKFLCVENMDKRKPVARTRDELRVWFQELPEASLCMDLAHARQIDPTMTEAHLILRDFGGRLAEVHISEVNSACKHEAISHGAMLAFRQVASLVPASVAVIIESVISADFIDDEIDAADLSLATDRGHPRIRARRSGATPKPIHA